MADFPLFQKTLEESTPFGGTMADTSTPTPTGTEEQGPPQLPETPQATELPGNAGDRVRLKKIQEDRSEIERQLNFWANAVYMEQNPWHRRFKLGMYGRAVEPASMMYKRHEMMQGYLRADAVLAEEERLLTTLNPADLKNATDAASRKRRQELANTVNEYHQIMGLPRVPIENEMQFVETGYGLNASVNKQGEGEDDALAMMRTGALIGADVGEEGVTALGLEGKVGTAAKYGAIQAKIEADKKAAEKEGAKGQFAGFDTMSGLTSAVASAYDDIKKQTDVETVEKWTTPNPIPNFPPVEHQRVTIDKENAKKARKMALARFRGAAAFLPDYVEQGEVPSTGEPSPVVDPAQGDIDKIKIRSDLKDRANPKK